MWKKRKICLVLGSGGARGWAHLGVIKALRHAQIPIHCVVGTSIGSLIAAAVAAGKVDMLESLALRFDLKRILYYFLDISIPRSGLIDGNRIEGLVRDLFAPTQIEDLEMPFRAVATDIHSGREIIMGSGSLTTAIRASISVAGIFTPVERDGHVLVDGGLVDPLPVRVARSLGADYIIASELNLLAYHHHFGKPSAEETHCPPPDPQEEQKAEGIQDRLEEQISKWDPGRLGPLRRWLERDALPNVFDVIGNARRIIQAQVTMNILENEPPDLLIQPEVGHLEFMDHHRAREAITAGFEEGLNTLGDLSSITLRRLR